MTLTGIPSIGGTFYLAYSEAEKANKRQKMAAIIVKGGTVLAAAHNKIIDSDPKALYGCSIHAERAAISLAPYNISGSKILVYRFYRKNDELASSKPCSSCAQAIVNAGISWAYYIDSDSNLIKVRSHSLFE